MSLNSPTLSLIVPTYNEENRIAKSLHTLVDYLNESEDRAEVIIVDDGSTDRTVEIAENALQDTGNVPTHVIRNHPNRGKGHAVRTGLLKALAPIAVFTDADLSTPISELPKLVDPIRAGDCDLAFGSRSLERNLIGVHQPWRREQGGKVFNLVVRLATGLPYWDTQCGFKAFNMIACRPLIEAATIDRFAFDVELLYLAQLAKLRLQEIPVRWDHNDGSKVNVIRDSLRMLGEVRSIRQRTSV